LKTEILLKFAENEGFIDIICFLQNLCFQHFARNRNSALVFGKPQAI